ncbi:MAG: alpha/beta hydrolase, partial [Candidatus Sumerlaeota bacterium]|nr:alpha/beta hydrolase [Candidatus Sumerlaeota bacterium]
MKPCFIAAALWLGASALVWPQESGNKGAAGDRARSKTAARIAAKKAARVGNAEAGTSPTLENMAYGDHAKHRIDLWLAKSDQPAPLLAFFHGGGGDKMQYRGNKLLEFCLQNGISCASVNYRENNQWPFPIPMEDAARAIQFLRLHAADYHIDPKRVATWGTSLGANVTTWLGYHDDLAKPDSKDPVERESTRLLFVVTSAGQTFNDMQLFRERVYPYNIPGASEGGGANTDRTKAHELSAIYHVTKDDPPIFMTYGIALQPLPLPKDTPRGEL